MSANQTKDRFIDSKVVTLFQSLSKEEVKVFKKYLSGTSYKENNDVFKLFEFLKKHHPNCSEAKVNTEAACLYIYLEDEVPKRKFLQLRTNLAKVLEDFLIKLQLEKSQPDRDFMLMNALKDRQLDNLFFQKVKDVRKKWEIKRPVGIEQLHNEYKLEALYYDSSETSNIDEVMNSIKKRIDNLDTYYLAKRLHLSQTLALSKNYLENEEDQNEQKIISIILELSNQSKFSVKPEIALFNLILKELRNDKFKKYDEILNIFKKTFNDYDKDEQHDILNFLTHSCLKNQLKNQSSNLNLFDLTKWSVEEGLYVNNNGNIDGNQFINIVNIACRAEAFDWANNFIKKYSPYLEKNIKIDIASFCTAICLHRAKRYEEVANRLSIMNFSNVSIGIHARCLQLMAYTELRGKDEFFLNLTKALKAIIERDKILAKERKEGLLYFIHFIKKIYKLKYRKNNNADGLIKEIRTTDLVSYKNWLISKINN